LIDKNKRKKMEELIYKVFNVLDPSGSNTEKYKEMFGDMSDNMFDTFFRNLFKNENQYLILETIDYEKDLQLEDVEKAAKILNVPLFEKLVMPFVNMDKDKPVVSKYEVPVGYAHLKRVQQILSKKNTTSTDITSRSAITGQVIGKDKNARDSDQENFALVTLGAENILRELLGPRSDDMVMKNEMYAAIAQKGYVSLSELTDKVENKTTLNTLDTYLIGLGIKSDLITEGLVLKKTLE
jgi:NADH dehydrogenase/NADH:ubiquinone oxidoreductase subunit G